MDADVGAIIGWTHTRDIDAFVAACYFLAAQFAPRSAPPQILKDMAVKGEGFTQS